MDLAELLAHEGYIPTDLSALLAWARARAGELVATIDASSPLRALLTGPAGHVPANSRSSAPSPGLTVDLEDVEPTDDDDALDDDVPTDLRSAVAAATAPHPAAEEEDVDSGFGGFTRFGGFARMNRPYPMREDSRAEERPTLARSFAMAVQDEEKVETPKPTPAPAAPTGELSSSLPVAALGMSAEESGGLVLGIPDEESVDVPLPRLGSNSVPNRRFVVSEPDPEPEPGLSDSSVALANLTESLDPNDSGEFLGAAPAPAPRTVAQEPVGVDLRQPIPVSRREQTGPRDAAIATSDDPSDPQAPVIRHRNPKKRVVDLGAPIVRSHSSSATAKVVPRPEPSVRSSRKTPPPPPPGPLRRTPAPIHDDEDDIQELSRVEVLDDLPAYLRDDED